MIKIAGIKDNVNEDISEALRTNYNEWRNYRQLAEENYFILPKELENYLPVFSDRALNLYLYYCFCARNDTGVSWHSINTAAEKLEVSTRSINKWNSSLEEAGLITRVADNHSSKTTYLLPISNYYRIEKKDDVAELLRKSNENIDGKLVAMHHLFEWRSAGKGKNKYTKPYNVLCCVFERKYKVDNKNFIINKFVLIEDERIKDFKLETNATEMFDDLYRFEDNALNEIVSELPFNINSTDLTALNFAVNSKINLTDDGNKKVLNLLNGINENLERKDEITIIK